MLIYAATTLQRGVPSQFKDSGFLPHNQQPPGWRYCNLLLYAILQYTSHSVTSPHKTLPGKQMCEAGAPQLLPLPPSAESIYQTSLWKSLQGFGRRDKEPPSTLCVRKEGEKNNEKIFFWKLWKNVIAFFCINAVQH